MQKQTKQAPRVTLAEIESKISSEHYFTAADGVRGEGGDTRTMSALGKPESLELLTFCVLVLENGYTVVGQSACVSKDNYDPEIGRKVARDNAINQMWPLLGYELKTQMMLREGE